MTTNLSNPVLDPRNQSYDTLRRDFISYIQSRSDYGSWKDVLGSSAGTTLLELLSGFGAYINFQSTVGRRENYLDQAQLRSSVILIANSLGYVTNRASAPSFTVRLNVTQKVSVTRNTVVATYLKQPLVPLQSQDLIPGLNTIELVFGEWRSLTFTITNPTPFQRLFIEDKNVDNILNSRLMVAVAQQGANFGTNIKLSNNVEDILQGEPFNTTETFVTTDDVDPDLDYIWSNRQHFAGESIKFVPSGNQSLPAPLLPDVIYFIVPYSSGDPERAPFRLTTSFDSAVSPHPNTIDLLPFDVEHPLTFSSVPSSVGLTLASRTILVRTVVDGVLLLFGDGVFGYQLQNNDIVTVDYLHTLGTLNFLNINTQDFVVNIKASVNSIVDSNRGSNADSIDKVRTIAPAYFGSQRNMLTKEDHNVIFKGYSGSMISTACRKLPFTPTPSRGGRGHGGGRGGGGLDPGIPETFGVAADGTNLTWNYYPPVAVLPPRPVILVIHGGGFVATPSSPNTIKCCTDLAAAGYVVFRITYRLAPPGSLPGQVSDGRFPQQSEDVAIAVIAAREDERGTGSVGACGGSAGAHHALTAAGIGLIGEDRVDCFVSMSAATNFAERAPSRTLPNFVSTVENYVNSTDLAVLLAASPISRIEASISPGLIYNSLDEAMPIQQHYDLVNTLDDLGVTNYTAVVRQGTAHSFAYWPAIKEDAIVFFNQHLS